jgi:heme-degrading monooxygenase HmoA
MKLPFLLTVAALTLWAQPPSEIFKSAQAKAQQAGQLAQQGKFAEVNELLLAADEGMDLAVAAEPENLEFRARRGVAYSFRSYMPGKAETALQDLKFASGHPRFSELPETLRRQVARQLTALTAKPDRFPAIAADATPVIAAASFTIPSSARSVPAWVSWTVASMKDFPGLLGTHVMSSVEHPGMYVVFTWWKDKQALNDFFYSDVHRSWTQQRGLTMSRGASATAEAAPADVPTQTALEVFVGAAGGSQVGGGVIPANVFEMLRRGK